MGGMNAKAVNPFGACLRVTTVHRPSRKIKSRRTAPPLIKNVEDIHSGPQTPPTNIFQKFWGHNPSPSLTDGFSGKFKGHVMVTTPPPPNKIFVMGFSRESKGNVE